MGEDDERQIAGRLGLLGHGIYYLLLTLLCARLLVGGSGGQETGPRGAIATVAQQPFGQVLLAGLTLAFIAYAGMRWARAVLDGDDLGDRAQNALRGTVWTALSVLAGHSLLTGISGGGGSSGTSITRTVLDAPGGTWVVTAVGIFLAGVAAFQLREATDGALGHELHELGLDERRAARWLGRTGYLGRTLAYALVALFVIRAALTHDASAGRGLDGALQQAQQSPWGPWLLGTVTIGFGAFGLFRLVEARFARDPS